MIFLKSIKKAMLLASATYIIVGLCLIINKYKGLDLTFQILALGTAITGLLSMIRYFLIKVSDRIKRDDFIVGTLLIALAAIIYLSRKDISYLSTSIFGIMMIMSAFFKIQDMLDSNACGYNRSGFYLLLFIIGVAFGVVSILCTFSSDDLQYVVIGVGMIFSGLTDLLSNFLLAGSVYGMDKKEKQKAKEEETSKQEVIDEIQEINEHEIVQEEEPIE